MKLIISSFSHSNSVFYVSVVLLFIFKAFLSVIYIYFHLMYTSRLKYDQLTVNAPIFSNHSIAIALSPIPPDFFLA